MFEGASPVVSLKISLIQCGFGIRLLYGNRLKGVVYRFPNDFFRLGKILLKFRFSYGLGSRQRRLGFG